MIFLIFLDFIGDRMINIVKNYKILFYLYICRFEIDFNKIFLKIDNLVKIYFR